MWKTPLRKWKRMEESISLLFAPERHVEKMVGEFALRRGSNESCRWGRERLAYNLECPTRWMQER